MNRDDLVHIRECDAHRPGNLADARRRWLVDPDALGSLDRYRRRAIHDIYVSGLRICLRRICEAQCDSAFLFCRTSFGYARTSEPEMIRALSALEFEALALSLCGSIVDKTRYDIDSGWLDIFSLDQPHIIFSVDGAMGGTSGYVPPHFARTEVSGDADYCDVMFAVRDIWVE